MSALVSMFVKISAITTMVFLPMGMRAKSVTSESVVQKLRIDFTRAPEWWVVTRIDAEPQKIVINLIDGKFRVIHVADFVQEGDAGAEVVAVFKSTVNSRDVLFIIVKWHYYLSGVDTEGDYYEVHAYEASKFAGGGNSLSENRTLSQCFGAGFDGKMEGGFVKFRYKDANSIREVLHLKNRFCQIE